MTDSPEAPWDGRRETVIIINPAAHNVPNRKRLQEADAWLQDHGWRAEWQETAGPGDATGMAVRAAGRGVPLVFVCGGDGTLNEAANGLAYSETALAVIPGGTTNVWAREAGLRKKPREAVRLAVEGDRRRIDLGRAGSRYFVLMAGYGLDASVVHRVSTRAKRRLGAAAYAIGAAREVLTYHGTPMQMTFDGETAEGDVLMVVAGNTRGYAGLTQITPDALADDGLLDVCVYQGRGRMDIAAHALRTLVRRHRKSRKVLYRRVARLEMAWEQPLLLQVDGDVFLESPSEVTVAPGALWVALPRDFRGRLFSDSPVAAPAV